MNRSRLNEVLVVSYHCFCVSQCAKGNGQQSNASFCSSLNLTDNDYPRRTGGLQMSGVPVVPDPCQAPAASCGSRLHHSDHTAYINKAGRRFTFHEERASSDLDDDLIQNAARIDMKIHHCQSHNHSSPT